MLTLLQGYQKTKVVSLLVRYHRVYVQIVVMVFSTLMSYQVHRKTTSIADGVDLRDVFMLTLLQDYQKTKVVSLLVRYHRVYVQIVVMVFLR